VAKNVLATGRAALVALATAALAVACSSGITSSAGGGGGATSSSARRSGSAAAELAPYLKEPGSLPNWPALKSRPPTGKTVYYINSGSLAGQIIAAGLRQACSKLGWKLTVLTYDDANLETANSDYLTAVNSGGAVIVSTGIDQNVIAQGLTAAKQHHVVVIQTESAQNPATTPFYNVDNNLVNRALYGKVLALAFAADAAAAGTVAHVGVVTTSGIPVVYAESVAEQEAIVKYCHSCTAALINVPVTQVLGGEASEAVISFIQRNPDTNYVDIAGAVEGGMRAALDNAGLSRVKIGGFQPTPAQNAQLKAGGSQFWLQLSYGYEAWLAIDTAARALTGSDPDIHNTAPSVVWLVDRQNLNFSTSALPDFPIGYRADFEKLWHVAS